MDHTGTLVDVGSEPFARSESLKRFPSIDLRPSALHSDIILADRVNVAATILLDSDSWLTVAGLQIQRGAARAAAHPQSRNTRQTGGDTGYACEGWGLVSGNQARGAR